MTPRYYTGDTLEETERKFIQKVTFYGFAEKDKVKTVLFKEEIKNL